MATTAITGTGTVRTVNLDRGFGFIQQTGGLPDVFFHCTALDRSLEFDDTLIACRVTFGVIATEKGLKAINVRKAD